MRRTSKPKKDTADKKPRKQRVIREIVKAQLADVNGGAQQRCNGFACCD